MNGEHEQRRVFIELIDDILSAAPGLHYRLDRPEPDEADGVYAVFTIETNPAHALAVAIELLDDDFRLRVNDETFCLPIESRRRPERWMERRCRDVERLVEGDLKIETESLLGRYLSSGLFAGREDRWAEIADRDEGWGWIGLAAWLLPFGLSPLRSREIEYKRWYEVG